MLVRMALHDKGISAYPQPFPAGPKTVLGSRMGTLGAGLLLFSLVCLPLRVCSGYSLLTHEELVDILWQDQIQPLLLQRFPGATSEELRQAHAYAYGGSLIQDIGYYPFGNKFFSDLTHYVRTGDFVANLIREARNLDDFAFALGALSHYASDNSAHPLINRSVALLFPKLRARYGQSVTYEDDPKAHIRTELGFDITQVSKRRYTSDQYHAFIGFEVSKPLLERACLATYGLSLEQVLGHVDLAVGTFRHAVSQVVPEMTRAALSTYHPELVREIPNFSKKRFLYNLSRAQYEAEWGREYRRPGLFARLLGWFVRWVPKIGPLKALAFKVPTPQTEALYITSVNRAVENYRGLLRQVSVGQLGFPNTDCDTGRLARPGEYFLSDETYARLLDAIVKRAVMPQPDLRANLLDFFSGAAALSESGRNARWPTALELAALRAGLNSTAATEIRQYLLAPPFKLQSPKGQEADDSTLSHPGHWRLFRDRHSCRAGFLGAGVVHWPASRQSDSP